MLEKKIAEISGLAKKEDEAIWAADQKASGIRRSKITTFSDSGLLFQAFDDTAGVGFMNKQNPRLSVAVLQVAEKGELLYTEISKLSTEQTRNLVRQILEVDLSPANRQLAQSILEYKPELLNQNEEYCLKPDEINKIMNGPVASPEINPATFSEALKEALAFPANKEVALLLMKSVIYDDLDPKAAFNKLSDSDLKDLVSLNGDNMSRHILAEGPGYACSYS